MADNPYGPPDDYFTPPKSAPMQEIRGLFSQVGNWVLNVEDKEGAEQGAKEILREILAYDRYDLDEEALVKKFDQDYKSVCQYWEETWRYTHGWPDIEKYLREVINE
ncbi:hypothetical protein [Vibrio sp. SCSIO 43136]|uniref:hypothetical protein n=1 Tax=Vibrio sp. SCSIO 43136 TaxID=2819101 RepID=UPI0020763194|nr:hypothetical protein [Vibrio sp. SCSIO 43136]USD66811.1 hypothetical protein J4N39_19345 [Vibrio sp. SCSIO 43136]